MLLIIANWLSIVFLAYIFGHFLWRLLPNTSATQNYLPHFSVVCVLGLMLLTSLSAAISLFYRISWEANLLFLILALAYLLFRSTELMSCVRSYLQQVKGSSPLIYLLFAAFTFFALSFSSYVSSYHDDGLYYIQTIKWIQDYGAVPGLGNLQLQLGFNTNWHVLSALFSWSFLDINGLHDINALLYVLMILFFLKGLQNIFRGSDRLSDYIRCLFILPLFFFMKLLSAPSADLPALLLIWLTFCMLIEYHEKRTDARLLDLACLFCLYLISLKLSTLSVCLISIFIFFRLLSKSEYLRAFTVFAVGSLVILPWLARNAIISGYLIYPFAGLDLFSFDWKMHPEAVKVEAAWVTSYAIDPSIHPDELSKMTMREWLPIWFSNLSLFNLGIVLAAFVSLLTMGLAGLYFFFKQKSRYLYENTFLILIFITCLSGLTLWLIKAPDPRFSYGFTLFLIFFGIAFILSKTHKTIPAKTIRAMLVSALFGMCLLNFAAGYHHYRIFDRWYFLKPAENPQTSLEEVKLPGFSVYVPDNRIQCWDSPLPCTKALDMRLRMRGEDFSSGFKILHELPPEKY